MARRKRSDDQLALLGGIESWYMPAAATRGRLQRVLQALRFVDHPQDLAARDLIEAEARDALETLGCFVLRWQAFWQLVFDAEMMDRDEVVAMLRSLNDEQDAQWREYG